MTAPVYRLSPNDHYDLQDVLEALWAARELLGFSDVRANGERWNGGPWNGMPSDVDVLTAGQALSQAIMDLSEVESRHADETDEIAEAARQRAENDAQNVADEARYEAEDARRKAAGEPSQDEEAQQRLAEQGRA